MHIDRELPAYGITPFCESIHDAVVWGFGGDAEDPDTYERVEGRGWERTGFPLSELIVYLAVSGAVFASEDGLQNTSSTVRNCEDLISRMVPLEPRIWSWPDPAMRFYCRGNVIAQIGIAGTDFDCQMLLAAPTADELETFEDLEWDY